jgi:hypothetical protein
MPFVQSIEMQCGLPPTFENAVMKYNTDFVGDRVSYACKIGYEIAWPKLQADAYLTCNNEKKWTMNFSSVPLVKCQSMTSIIIQVKIGKSKSQLFSLYILI